MLDKFDKVVDGIQVLGNNFFILNLDLESIFDKHNQLQYSCGVDYSVIQKRCVIVDFNLIVKNKIFVKKLTDLIIDGHNDLLEKLELML